MPLEADHVDRPATGGDLPPHPDRPVVGDGRGEAVTGPVEPRRRRRPAERAAGGRRVPCPARGTRGATGPTRVAATTTGVARGTGPTGGTATRARADDRDRASAADPGVTAGTAGDRPLGAADQRSFDEPGGAAAGLAEPATGVATRVRVAEAGQAPVRCQRWVAALEPPFPAGGAGDVEEHGQRGAGGAGVVAGSADRERERDDPGRDGEDPDV